MNRDSLVRFSLAVGLVLLLSCAPVLGQVFKLTPEQLTQYTAQNPYERFPDGRPKVPDAILDKVRGLSAEEILGIGARGFPNQFADGFQILHPGKKLVGRAVTLQLMPIRADVSDAQNTEWKTKTSKPLNHQTVIDMLQPGDVFVVDAGGNLTAGGIVGDNLSYYIWKTTGAGFVIDGAIRDLEGVANFDMAGYFRGTYPRSASTAMVTGVNVPIRIGDATVMPGDVVFGDRAGVFFIPPQLVQQVVEQAETTQVRDEWSIKMFDTGKYKSSEIYGTPRDPELRKQREEYIKQRVGEKR